MTFRKMIALVAMFGLTAAAHAEGILRQEAPTPAASAPATGAALETKVEETKTVETAPDQTKSVEVKKLEVKVLPAQDPVAAEAATRTDQLRKARAHEEIHTEEKIAEKLEASRLTEEQKRADKIMNGKLDEAPAQTPPTVHIEKVEIVQPTQITSPTPAAPIVAPAPVAEKAPEKAPVEEAAPAPAPNKYYVGGNLAAPDYNAVNVRTNFGLGATFGSMITEDFALEGSFNYSNFYVNNVWSLPLFKEMDQYEFQVALKWFPLNDLMKESRVRPFVGVSASYIMREYTNRQLQYYNYNPNQTSQDTNAVNLGIMLGVDFMVTQRFSIGGEFDYSHPVMTKNDFDLSSYGINDGTTKVESWDFTTLKLTAKFHF